jgi:hypothetical protein
MTTAPITKKSIFNRPRKPYVHPYLGDKVSGRKGGRIQTDDVERRRTRIKIFDPKIESVEDAT